MKKLLVGLLFWVSLALPVAARENCTKVGCSRPWSSCRPGVKLPNGDTGYGQTRHCCDPQGRWYAEARACGGPDVWSGDLGVFLRKENVAFRDDAPVMDWQLDTTGIEAGLRPPALKLGEWTFAPRISAGAGRAEASLNSSLGPRTFDAIAWTAGAEIELDPPGAFPLSFFAGARYGALHDVKVHGDRPTTLDYSAVETMAGLRASLLGGRLEPSLGYRQRDAEAPLSMAGQSHVSPPMAIAEDLELDQGEVVGGLDVHFTPWLSFHVAAGPQRTEASLTYHFNSSPPTPQNRTEPDPEQRPEQDCSSGIPVCRAQYVQERSYRGPGTKQEAGGTCLGTAETNSVWYIFTVQTGGSLAFTIETTNDYDFALYDITSGGCAAVPGAMPVRCNYSGMPGLTGLELPPGSHAPQGVDSGGSPLMPALQVTAGETYALVVDNFSSDANGYTLTFGGTAVIFDAAPPALASAAFIPSSREIEIVTSEPVRCASIAPDGSDFTIASADDVTVTSAAGVGCGAFTKTIRLTYTLGAPEGCGTWHIRAKSGSDGNSLIDNCGNALEGDAPLSVVMSPNAVAHLEIGEAFCEGAPISADGSGSQHEQNHFWSVVESDANWNVIGKECMRWFTGPAGTLDVAAFARQEGCPLQCGRYYRVKLAVQNCATQWDETVKLIRIQCPPVADAGKDKGVCCCGPQKIPLGAPPAPGVQYDWTPAIGLSDPSIANPVLDMSVFSDPAVAFPSVYEVTATDSLGCSSKDTVYVKTVCGCRPGATIAASSPSLCSRSVTLTANCDCGDATPSYLWSNGATTKSIEVTNGGTYTVTCSNECGTTVSQPVTVPAVSPLAGGFPSIQCPNVFTPNGDGVNDFWTVTDLSKPAGHVPAYNATEYELTVFDRWGSTVAVLYGSTTAGFANGSIPGWNGVATVSALYNWWQGLWGKENTYAGDAVSDGTYYYILKMRNCETGWTEICHSFFTVIR